MCLITFSIQLSISGLQREKSLKQYLRSWLCGYGLSKAFLPKISQYIEREEQNTNYFSATLRFWHIANTTTK